MRDVVDRLVEVRAVARFLHSAQSRPAALIVEGEAGIGKSTVWRGAVEEARGRGFRVLSARAVHGEAQLAYGTLAGVLADLDGPVVDLLPHVQRVAFDRVLRRRPEAGPATDERIVAAAVLTLLEHLTVTSPVLVAVDDAQWLDSSSRAVLAFAARRLRWPVGMLLAERTGSDGAPGATWLQLPTLGGVERVRIGPLAASGLHTVLTEELGDEFSRTSAMRIAELSGGNPFYALELARTMVGRSPLDEGRLPASLSDLVRTRLDELSADTVHVLLAAASVGTATVDLLAAVTDRSPAEVVELLEEPEDGGVVVIEGNRVRFTHPLLARGVHDVAGPARQRAMHARLAEVIDDPELRTRHRALSGEPADATTLDALDDAAAAARTRGAPAAAAELLDLALALGGPDPARRILAADSYFHAGDGAQARKLLEGVIAELPAGPQRAQATILLATVHAYDDGFAEAVRLLTGAVTDAAGDAPTVVTATTLLSYAHFQIGQFTESLELIDDAVAMVAELGDPALTSQVLAVLVTAKFHLGRGVDRESLQRALELEDHDAVAPFALRASTVNAFIKGWIGEVDEASVRADELRQRLLERGAEKDLMAIAGHRTLIELWRGDFARAGEIVDETVRHADLAGGDMLRVLALTLRAVVAAYCGRDTAAREDAEEAIAIALRDQSPEFAVWPSVILAFLETSLMNYEAALTAVQPMVDLLGYMPGAEIMHLWFLPDAVEAMIGLGKLGDAEPLIEQLEVTGARLDRTWLVATGARCRAMWHAARQELPEALAAAHRSMAAHDALPMPFDRARSLLVRGRLQRTARAVAAATADLTEALREFERMGAAVWADRARAELAALSPAQPPTLTAAELRVAELAVTGMTNRDVASSLSVSLKTVEANLTQIYRKLGIRSRSQLAQRLRTADDERHEI